MRKMIAAMKISIDGKTEGPDGYADWVEAWSDDYGLTSQVDACVLGGGMYPGYEQYWTPIRDAPDQPNPLGTGVPTPAEVEWARFTDATTVRTRNGGTLISDGPFAETKEQVGGFALIECDHLDDAIEAAARHPFAAHGVVEVRPVWDE